jgi:hypothetical protein
MKQEYIDLALPDNTTGWKQGCVLVVGLEWTNHLAMLDTQELKPLLDDLEQLKAEGLTGAVVAISFCRSLI